jgi:hypothetical protein
MPIDRSDLPCWSCTRPQGEEVRHWLRSCSNDDLANCSSPGGLPLDCCRVRVVGVAPQSPGPRPAA